MAKISKIRFVNFTYNEYRHIYDQTIDFYNGEDTLLSLQNGGGKTVLVQMMMQPIVPNQRLKERLFKSYFLNAKAPGYIMIEWILDDHSKRVLTGIGVKRIASRSVEDESDSIKIVTFISEYEEGSNYDIKNIELTKEERGVVRLIEFEKVIKNLSEAEKEGKNVWIFRQNITDDRKEYARRLMEYKINPSEWKNLMVKINEAEAGLNSFFNDCKTNKALVKKWFIPTIEEQLNKNGNSIENLKELIKNHAEQLVKNEDMIEEREIFEDFKNKSTDIITSLKGYYEILAKSEKNQSEIGNAYVLIGERIKKRIGEKEEIIHQSRQVEDMLKQVEYQRLSFEYYKIEDDLARLNECAYTAEKETEKMKEELKQLEYKKDLLSCIKIKEELRNLNHKIAKFETELEKESLKQEDIKNIMQDIQYSLKEKYNERMLRNEKALETERLTLSDKKNQLVDSLEMLEKANKKIETLNEQLIRIRGRIGVFNESEAMLKSMYHDFDPMTMKNTDTHEYRRDSLEHLRKKIESQETEMEKNVLDIKEKRSQTNRKILRLEKETNELRKHTPAFIIEKNKKETAYQLFKKEKKEIKTILHSYQLEEEYLFQKEKLMIPVNADKEKYQKLINDLHLENSIAAKKIKQYESGKAFELSDELKKIFEEQNIYVEFGHEWLQNNPSNKKEKLKFVKKNPFLPYALIVSRKDFDMIKELEFKRVLSPIIPIVEREKLEEMFMTKIRNSVYVVDNIHFLIPFDDRLLNKNYLSEICEELSSGIVKNNDIIENAQEALKNIASDITKIERFTYTKLDGDKLKNEIKIAEDEVNENALKITQNEQEIHLLKEMDTEDMSLQNDLEHTKDRFLRKKEDIYGFIEKCDSYSKDLKDKREKERCLLDTKESQAVAENHIVTIKSDINDIDLKISNIASILEKDKLQYLKYADTKKGNKIEGEIENLESKLSVYTSKNSGKIQSLHDVLEDYRKQRNERCQALEGYGIEEFLYMGKEYQAYEYDKLSEESNDITEKLKKLVSDNNELQYEIAERNSDLKYRKQSINENCGCMEPLPREHNKELDFEQEKKQQKSVLKGLEKKISQVKKQENNLHQVQFILEEYQEFVEKIIEPHDVEGDMNEYVLDLLKEYKEYSKQVNDYKNILASKYIEIESEFTPKAEVFKNLFHSILNDERKYKPNHALNAFERVFVQIERKLEQHSIDIKKIDNMEKCIIDNALSYLKNVYDEMIRIDRNSTIDLDGKRCKMLIITLPPKEELESILLKEYLKCTILNCVELYKKRKPMDGLLANEICTYHLFDRLVSVNKVGITLIKIEPNKLKKRTWRQVIEQNSGGELFVSAFVVFISLLTYMRGDNVSGVNMESKVLIMDNPFGPITSEHLLKPLFEISKKYNTQMICLTDVKGHAIYDRFQLIYSLNVEREVGREDEYIECKTIKKDIHTEEEEILSASMFKIEDKSRFELVN